MSPAGFEPAIPASKRPQTHALDRAATGLDIGLLVKIFSVFVICYAEVVPCVKILRHLMDTWPVDRKLNVRTEYFTLCNGTAIYIVRAK